MLNTLRIVYSEVCVEQYRFPRTKKRRIRNKWAARPGNFRPSRNAFITDTMIVMHPSMQVEFESMVDKAPHSSYYLGNL